jgi:FAD/FMN-containing dehydrogenase
MDSQLIERLVSVVGKDYVLHTPEDLAVYSYDGTFTEGQPDVVVLPATTEQVSQIVALLRAAGLCAGWVGLAAGSIPISSGGIVVG